MTIRRIVRPNPRAPSDPSPFDPQIAYALKALNAGTANEGQQKRAIAWIVNIACATYETTYFPGSARDTDFAAGKRWIGMQIVGLVNMDPSLLAEK